MIKYAKIINEETGLVNIGLGTDVDYYKSIGMKKMDVEQSDIDNEWYIKEKCPHKTEHQKELERKEDFHKNFFNSSLGYIRRKVTMANGDLNNFLTDLLPSISLGVQSGLPVKVIAYDEPPFDRDITDWTEYQHNELATPQFIAECLAQLQADFGIIEK